EIAEYADYRHATDELGNKSKLDEVLRFHLRQQFGIALVALGECRLFRFVGPESHGALAQPSTDDALQAHERPAANEEDVGGVHRSELLVGMLTSSLRRNVRHSAFQDLQQRLLHTFAGN